MSVTAPEKSNWNRWGADDQRGAVNLLTPERVLAALRCASTGQVVNLGSQVGKHGAVSAGRNATWHVTTTVTHPTDHGRGRAEDILVMHTHAHSQLDGLGHVWYDGHLYNGVPSSAIGRGGARKLSIEHVGGMVARGVLLDITAGGERTWEAGELITASDLEAASDRAGVVPASGDVILLRTGWLDRFLVDDPTFHDGEPGLDPSGVDWVVGQDPAAIGFDNFAGEPLPSPKGSNPLLVHETLLRDHGIYMMELLDFKELAGAGATTFTFVCAPLLVQHGLGSPINPLAIL